MVFHNEDGNPARANIKQALGYLKDGDGDGNSQHLRYQLLANCLSTVLDKLVSPTQSAFISGRQILDGPLMVSEIIEWYRKRNKRLMIFKVDFKKALTRLERDLQSKRIKGVTVGNPSINSSHFFFADDVMILSEWDSQDLQQITCSLNSFYQASGHKINIAKSNLFGIELTNQKESDGNNKMALVRWDNVLASFDQGGLGIGSLKAFNLALLQKWRCRFNTNSDLLLVKLIKDIHGSEAGFDGEGCATSRVWSSIVDLWLGNKPLCSRYNQLFHLDINENCLISNRYNARSWNWQWSRPIDSGRTASMLLNLQLELTEVTLSSSPVSYKWHIGNDGSFSVSSTRTHIDHLILPSLASLTRWTSCLPRKVNIFLWRFCLDRLPHC
ncbi:hypothetical protein Tco_1099126 [Tanacetum coccineum]